MGRRTVAGKATSRAGVAASAAAGRMLNPIVQACLENGCYTLSSGTMEPSVVLQRLLDFLLILDSDAHRTLTSDESTYAVIPHAALHEEKHPWWGSEAARELLESIMCSIDIGMAPHGFICAFVGTDHFVLERFDAPGSHAPTRAGAMEPQPSISMVRARARPGGPGS